MNKADIATGAVELIVTAGVTKIVKATIKNNVSAENTVDTVTIAAGSYVIGSMVAHASRKHVEMKIESWRKSLAEAKAQVKVALEEDVEVIDQ